MDLNKNVNHESAKDYHPWNKQKNFNFVIQSVEIFKSNLNTENFTSNSNAKYSFDWNQVRPVFDHLCSQKIYCYSLKYLSNKNTLLNGK